MIECIEGSLSNENGGSVWADNKAEVHKANDSILRNNTRVNKNKDISDDEVTLPQIRYFIE